MNDPQPLTFEPWADPTASHVPCDPEGTYSRLAWLPLIGPSSWLVWGTLAAQLRREPSVTWELEALAEAHGLSRGGGEHAPMRRTLARLAPFGLLDPIGDDRHLVRLTAPPVGRRHLERLPAYVAEIHHQTFGQDPHRQVG